MKNDPVINVHHRGMVAQRTSAGYWVLETPITGPWRHWSRFFTAQEEQQCGPDSDLDMKQQEAIVRTTLDRVLANQPIYTCDLRDQHIVPRLSSEERSKFHLNGIACPKCGNELVDTVAKVPFSVWNVYCDCCGYRGVRTDYEELRGVQISEGLIT